MSVSAIRQILCVGEARAGKAVPQPFFDSTVSCSLDSRLPDIPIPIDNGETIIRFSQGAAHQGVDFPPNVICKIVELAGPKEQKALHRVNRAWRDAVCQGLLIATPTTFKADMLSRFPKVETLGWENVSFTCGGLARHTQLKALTLHSCSFKHSIADLASLQGLEKLRLRDVANTGVEDMDALLASVTNLTSLELKRGPDCVMPHSSAHAMQLPSLNRLSSLTNLQELLIEDAYQGMRMPNLSQLSHLSQLRRLAIAKISVDNIVVRAICRLPNLECVEIPDCYSITNSALPDLGMLQGLTKLDLRWSSPLNGGAELNDLGMQCLSPLTNLASLNLAGHRDVSSYGLHFLSDFFSLTSLCLAGVPLHSGGADFLAGLSSLQTLNLSKTLLTAAQLGFLGGLGELRSLNLSETYFGDSAAAQLSGMKRLETLKISYCPLSNVGFEAILASCPKLERVLVEGCWLSTLCLYRVIRRYPELKLWKKDESWLPKWMRKADVVLIAQTQPYSRRLRVLYQGEGSWGTSLAVGVGVVYLIATYTVILLLLFAVVAFFPLCLLGIASLFMGIVSMAARGVMGSDVQPPRLLVRLENALSFDTPTDRRSRQERLADLV